MRVAGFRVLLCCALCANSAGAFACAATFAWLFPVLLGLCGCVKRKSGIRRERRGRLLTLYVQLVIYCCSWGDRAYKWQNLSTYCHVYYACLPQLVMSSVCRYPPVLDPKLEEAAAGLAAVMKDLAGMQQDVQALPPGATAAGSHKPADEVAKPQTAPDVVQKLTSLSHHIKALQAGDGQRQAGKADVAAESADESDDDNAELAIDSGDDDEDEDDEDQNLQGEEDLADEDEDDDMADDEDEDVDDAGSDEVEEGDVDDAPSADNSLELSASERTGKSPHVCGGYHGAVLCLALPDCVVMCAPDHQHCSLIAAYRWRAQHIACR